MPPREPETVGALLAARARARPQALFAVSERPDGATVQRTYEETLARAQRCAGLLAERGVRPGDRVHLHLINRLEFYDLWFGAAIAGAAIVPTNPLLTAPEIAYVVEHARCSLTVTEPDLRAAVEGVAHGRDVLEVGPGFDDALEGASAAIDAVTGSSDVAAVMYTSGTTSRPKGVLVTHANYLHAGSVVSRHLRITRDDRALIVLPLFHANAQYYSTMPALVTGSSVALMPRFSASRWGVQAAQHGATLASLFAAPIRMILAHPEHELDARNRLRAALFSQNVTEQQLVEFERRFNCPLLQLYGMTETIAPPLVNPLAGERRNLGIGLPTEGTRLRIVDETGSDVPPGEAGELLVFGEPGRTLMAGYLDDPEATRRALEGNWLRTGDVVRQDTDGYYYFVDRTKDMIKRAGENVAASEVEAVVNAHPAVFESAAVGVPDEVRDEAIKVFVVLHSGSAATRKDIVTWCSERLARFKVPTEVEFVSALPRTAVGKIQKHLLERTGGGEE